MKRFLTAVLAAALLLAGCAAPVNDGQPEDRNLSLPALDGPDEACPQTMAQPVYPAFPSYPESCPTGGDWVKFEQEYSEYRKAVKELRRDGLTEEDAAALEHFAEKTVRLALSGREGENAVYSPLSLWSALAMLAQCTDGNSRAQILNAAGAYSMEEMQERVSRIWRGLYTDNGTDFLLPANSLWLNSSLAGTYAQDTLDTLAEKFYAGVCAVPMGTAAADQAISDWASEQTSGAIGGNGPIVKTFEATVVMLVSSLCYRAEWDTVFPSGQTAPGIFTDASGTETEADFMHRENHDSFLRRDGYQAAAVSTRLGEMVFILPDEGTAPEALLADAGLLSGLDLTGEDALYGDVQWSIPKFDVEADLDLTDALNRLGVQDISNFSALTAAPASLTRAQQLARVQVDEDGVEAAALTILAADGCMGAVGPAPERCVMDLRRPFLFVTRMSGVPLFVGVVNRL